MEFSRASAEGKQGLLKLVVSLSDGEKISTISINPVVKNFNSEPEGVVLLQMLEKMFSKIRQNYRNEEELIWEAAFGQADIPYFSVSGYPFQAWALSYKEHDFLVLSSETIGHNIEFLTIPKDVKWLHDFMNDVNKLLDDGVKLAKHRRKEFMEMDLRRTAGLVNTEKVFTKV